jgi:hypothetical protein
MPGSLTVRLGPAKLGAHVRGEVVGGAARGTEGVHLRCLHRVHAEGLMVCIRVLLRGEDVTEVDSSGVVIVERRAVAVGLELVLSHGSPLGRS